MAEIMQDIKVLYIEDDKDSFEIVENYLSSSVRFNFNIEWACDYDEGLEKIKEGDYDVCLMDFYLCDRKSSDILKEECMSNINKPFVILTGENNKSTDIEMLKNGAIDYLVKDVIFPDKIHGSMLLERSIIYSIERKKLENQIKESYEIKNLLLNSTSSGICLVDTSTLKIIDCNESFKEMFGFNDTIITERKYDELFFVENDSVVCKNLKCPCTKSIREIKIRTFGDIIIDCLVQCKKATFKNNDIKTLKVITFVDITKQKKYQNKLIEMQESVKDVLKKYGLEEKNPEVLLDLVDLELDKFNINEEYSR